MLTTAHMRFDPAYRARLHSCGLGDVRSALARTDGLVVAWSRTTDTLHVSAPDGAPGLFLKRYYHQTWIKRLRSALRGTFFGLHRGHAEFLALRRMQELGISGVRAVAFGGRRVLHFLTAGFLITEEVPDAVNLTSLALEDRAGAAPLSAGRRRELLAALAGQVADMHAAGFLHGNLFWRNILIRFAPGGGPEFFFLDPQPPRGWEVWMRARRGELRELAQLAVSAEPFTTRSERLRFFHHYVGARRLSLAARQALAAIDAHVRPLRAHECRRIRMNAHFDRWAAQLRIEDGRISARSADAPATLAAWRPA